MRYKGKPIIATFPSRWVGEMIDFVNAEGGSPRDQAFRDELKPHLVEIARGERLRPTALEQLLVRARKLNIAPDKPAADGSSLLYGFKGKKDAIYCFDALQLNQLRHVTPTRYPGDLRQCQQCGDLFFLSELDEPYTRGQPSLYCGPECRAEAYAKNSTERVRRWRAQPRPAAKPKLEDPCRS